MPKVKLSLLETNTFLYEIDVGTRWARWHLEKKYPEFQELHRKLQNQFDNLPEVSIRILSSPQVSSTSSHLRMKTKPHNTSRFWRPTSKKHPKGRTSSIQKPTLSFCSCKNIHQSCLPGNPSFYTSSKCTKESMTKVPRTTFRESHPGLLLQRSIYSLCHWKRQSP